MNLKVGRWGGASTARHPVGEVCAVPPRNLQSQGGEFIYASESKTGTDTPVTESTFSCFLTSLWELVSMASCSPAQTWCSVLAEMGLLKSGWLFSLLWRLVPTEPAFLPWTLHRTPGLHYSTAGFCCKLSILTTHLRHYPGISWSCGKLPPWRIMEEESYTCQLWSHNLVKKQGWQKSVIWGRKHA